VSAIIGDLMPPRYLSDLYILTKEGTNAATVSWASMRLGNGLGLQNLVILVQDSFNGLEVQALKSSST
jgi:hypothetical protein